MDEDLVGTFGDFFTQRTIIRATCPYDQADCVSDAQAQFSAWMAVSTPDDLSTNPVNRHARSTIYCTALRNGGTAEAQFLQERANNCRNPQERSNLNSALSCASKDQGLKKHLEKVLLPGAYDVEDMAEALVSNVEAKAAIKDIFFSQDQDLSSKLFNDKVEEMIGKYLAFGQGEADLTLAQHLKELFENNLGRKCQHLSRAVEKVRRNMQIN